MVLPIPFSFQCVGITHTHTQTPHTLHWQLLASQWSHITLSWGCVQSAASQEVGRGMHDAIIVNGNFLSPCAWLFCWFIEQRSKQASLGAELYFEKNLVFLLSLDVIITSWDCHLEIHAECTKQAPGSGRKTNRIDLLFPWKCQQLLHNQHSSRKYTRAPWRAARLRTARSLPWYLQYLKASPLELVLTMLQARHLSLWPRSCPAQALLPTARAYALSFQHNDLHPRVWQPRNWWPTPSTWELPCIILKEFCTSRKELLKDRCLFGVRCTYAMPDGAQNKLFVSSDIIIQPTRIPMPPKLNLYARQTKANTQTWLFK